jgi:dihydrodipicolinate synthase/N-acetylneuraminate lyase
VWIRNVAFASKIGYIEAIERAEPERLTSMPGIPKGDLDSAIAFPILPFRNGAVDLSAHRRNVDYLVRNCFLDGGRKRVMAIGGSSLLHHLTPEEQLEVARVTGEQAGVAAWYISGIIPTPLRQAAWLVR